jgi:hypothetical protein
VLDEAFVNGRLVTCYRNANVGNQAHDEPADAFQLSIDKQDLSAGFQWYRPTFCRTRLHTGRGATSGASR